MDNLNDLKAIWLTAKTDNLPTSNEMVRLVKKFRNQRIFKKLAVIVMALVLAALMVTVGFIYKSTLITTRLGEAFMIIACGILATSNIKSLRRFYDLKDCSNKEFITFLEQTRLNQIRFYKKTQVIALLFCSSGLLLYIYEMVYQNTALLILNYAVTIAYVLVLTLVVRPRVYKREAKKLQETRDRLEKISNQL
jgi:membrane protein YdbS with pleckstrin-like domain